MKRWILMAALAVAVAGLAGCQKEEDKTTTPPTGSIDAAPADGTTVAEKVKCDVCGMEMDKAVAVMVEGKYCCQDCADKKKAAPGGTGT